MAKLTTIFHSYLFDIYPLWNTQLKDIWYLYWRFKLAYFHESDCWMLNLNCAGLTLYIKLWPQNSEI